MADLKIAFWFEAIHDLKYFIDDAVFHGIDESRHVFIVVVKCASGHTCEFGYLGHAYFVQRLLRKIRK